ncbi:hypothetical protein HETIRDRAFT_469980 [Heterobasidion irregulare TC 32-1]|uniref:Uncharacterized protein n=1 Tax=Heterobasidion irregulare (strain TC 32-1) TaxID=747525 RepID=W4KPI0_HETIT|nr:uncharacterized protein HETIRDRAFT_469980 [Heterobasidion irregulare TC 32-1]ETW87753.1 hypothetical protein HETIRDRAFT_469980 [Heterobasidion irregulare TC 32-1]
MSNVTHSTRGLSSKARNSKIATASRAYDSDETSASSGAGDVGRESSPYGVDTLSPSENDSSNVTDYETVSSDGEESDDDAEPGPDDLDEPWPYTFKSGDAVWVKSEGDIWYCGKVSGQHTKKGMTRQKDGLFYAVVFRKSNKNIRRYFAPLNGELKPHTSRTRKLLREAGWL